MLRRAPHLDDDRAAPLARSALGLRTLGLRTLGLLTLGQLALGCGAEETPGGAEAPPAAAAASPSVQAAVDAAATSAEELPCVEHEVAEGETLWHIARAYELTVAEIVEFNGLRPRDIRRLSKGRTLRIPGVREPREVRRERPPTLEELPALEDGAYHLISEGETLWDIARTYDKRVDELLERNGWSDEEVRSLRPGRAVIIPGIRQQEVRQASAEPGRGGVRGIRHTVRAGETIWDLARSFRVSVSELMAANALDAAGVGSIREGARLWIPGVAQDAGGGSVRRELSGRQRRALAHAARLGLGTRQAAQRLLRGQADARWIRAARGRRGRFAGTLAWPVTHGRYVRGYGSGEGGYHLAVDVAGDIGWNVRASAAGIVAYSGDEVPGYGNMVLVIHEGGWITMYAHNSVNFVVAGEQVPAGGVLAEVGSTGISRGPHVHYEFIYDGRNCDPASLFRPGVRHRSRLAAITRETWGRPDTKPESIRCARRRRHPRSRWVLSEDPDADADAESE